MFVLPILYTVYSVLLEVLTPSIDLSDLSHPLLLCTMDTLEDLLERYNQVLVYLGLFLALKTCLVWLGNIYSCWRSYVLPRIAGLFWDEDFVEKFGKWAVVTGCTGGIGREYALGLAKKGMNMVLVSRSRQKLEVLEKDILKQYKVKTMIIVADFTDIEVLDKIVEEIRESKIDVGVLVNNVGILGPHFMPFLELDGKIVKDMVTVNISAATILCHKLLPAMVKKKKGAVINIASFGSFLMGAYLAEYIATKHYMHAFTEAIAVELENTGVIVQEVDPAEVATEMTKDFAPSPGVPTAEVYVASILKTLGYSRRTLGYPQHGLQWLIFDMCPVWMRNMGCKQGSKRSYEHAIQKHGKSA